MKPLIISALCLLYAIITFCFVEISQMGTFITILMVVALAVSFIDIKIILALLPIMFAVSPKVGTGGVQLVFEDFIIPILLSILLLRIFLLKQEIYWSPLFVPIIAILLVNISTTLWWLFFGDLNLATSFFRNLKIIEYVSIFFLVTNTLNTTKEAEQFLWYLLLGGIAGGIYGTVQHFAFGSGPITGPPGEDYNTFAGFLLFYIALSLSIFAKMPPGRNKYLALVTFCITLFPFIYSFSRTSYVAFCVMLLYMGIFHIRIALLILAGVVASYFYLLPSYLVERIASIGDVFGIAANLPPAFMTRIDTWKWVYNWMIVKNPLFGGGIGRVTLMIDSEFLRILAETGFVGLICFLWFIKTIIKTGKAVTPQITSENSSSMLAALPVAVTAIIIAYFIHSLGSTTFTTIRTMEPFWFLIGILAVIMKIYTGSKGEEKHV